MIFINIFIYHDAVKILAYFCYLSYRKTENPAFYFPIKQTVYTI